MNKDFLECINLSNRGIVILDEGFKIQFWNHVMVGLTGKSQSEVQRRSLYEIFPKLTGNYYRKSIGCALEKGYQPFFSASLHRGLITQQADLNVRINRFAYDGIKLLLVECDDVTEQMSRVIQLKSYVRELTALNKRLQVKEDEVTRLAFYDQLTGVANRNLFFQMANKLLANAKRRQRILGLMFIDVDQFKSINDNYGHKVGDQVLIEVARILTASVRENDLVARYGGDEFVVILAELEDYTDYKKVAARIAGRHHYLTVDRWHIPLAFSIGVSFSPLDGDTVDTLLTKADSAMYLAKNAGGNNCVLSY